MAGPRFGYYTSQITVEIRYNFCVRIQNDIILDSGQLSWSP
jgi:hypothetical protein